jgi:signal transduction histidine kinase
MIAVLALGFTLFVLATPAGLRAAVNAAPQFLLFAALILVGTQMPLELPTAEGGDLATMAQPFAFALLLGWGVAAAVLAFGVTSLLAAAIGRGRKPLPRALFATAKGILALAAAGVVWRLLGGPRGPSLTELPAFAAAAASFLSVANLLPGATAALAAGTGAPPGAVRGARARGATGGNGREQQLWTSALLLALAPVMVAVADRYLPLIPLLALPMVALYQTARSAQRAERERARAEAAAEANAVIAAEQARMIQGKQALVRQLQDQERRKHDLLATVSHELRTPLTVVLGSLDTLSAHVGELGPDDQLELVGLASRQGRRLKLLVDQLLQSAREADPIAHLAGNGNTAPAPAQTTDGVQVVREVVSAARICHPARPIEVVAEATLPLRTGPEPILRVLTNLLDNAAKYSPDGTPIRVEARRDAGWAVLAVEDAGPGVPPADRERIFERFTQLEQGAARRAGGVGLGLWIARQLARNLGGDLLLAPPARPGGGARFELRLPLGQDVAPGAHAIRLATTPR